MTGQEIIQFYQRDLIDNSTESSESLLALLNVAYQRLLGDRDWHFLVTEDASQSITNSTEYDIPQDLLKPLRAVIASEGGGNYQALTPVRFEDRFKYQGNSRYFYIDYRNGKLKMLASPAKAQQGLKLHFEYLYKPANITLESEPVFISSYHPLLAYEMARHYWYKEQDTKSRSWNNEMIGEYELMKAEMVMWDDAHQNFIEPSQFGVSPYEMM